MTLTIIETKEPKSAEITTPEQVMRTLQEALDLMAEANYLGATGMIAQAEHFDPLFFDLSSGLAGSILQKFSQYQMKLAIIGDFDKYPSKSLKAFIAESNRGNQIFFVDSRGAAIERLTTAS